jgi:hypothetical protein
MPAQESSVMVALAELSRIESERIEMERAAEAERRRREAERRRREAERRQKEEEARAEAERHRLRVAEAEARLRVAEEVRAAEAVSRAQRIEAELTAVKAERAVLADQLFAQPSPVGDPLGLGFWRFASAALFIAAGLALVAVFAWPSLTKRPPPAPVVVVARPTSPPVDESAALKRKIDEMDERLKKALKDAAAAQRPVVIVKHKPAAPAARPTVSLSAADVDKIKDPLEGVTLKR